MKTVLQQVDGCRRPSQSHIFEMTFENKLNVQLQEEVRQGVHRISIF